MDGDVRFILPPRLWLPPPHHRSGIVDCAFVFFFSFLSLAAAFGHSLFFLHLGFLFIFSTPFLSLSLVSLLIFPHCFPANLSLTLSHTPPPLLPSANHNPTSLDALVFEIVYLASAHPPQLCFATAQGDFLAFFTLAVIGSIRAPVGLLYYFR